MGSAIVVRSQMKKGNVSRWHEIRFLALLSAGLCVLALATFAAIFSTTEPDIADLTPVSGKKGGNLILNWSDLERGSPHTLHEGSVFAGARVQALGYMMEGEHPVRQGDRVEEFVLLPEAGSLLHPAHRFGDQMIVVHLNSDGPVEFSPRTLVWVSGILGVSPGNPAGGRPLYDLEHARVSIANETEIRTYFR